MLHYDPPLFRPPSEADSLILQATLGCSFNRCSFCSMYRSKTFTVRPLEAVFAEIDQAARIWPDTRRVFLADGDAFVLPTPHLLEILERLDHAFPELNRVSSYAWPLQIVQKPAADLARLRDARLTLLYVGLESGSEVLLKKITKGASPSILVEALQRARESRLRVSATVILGLGGRDRADEHVAGTVAVVNAAPPNYLSTLQLGLEDVVEAEFFRKFKEPFVRQDDDGMLRELAGLLVGLAPPRPVIFRSNHASNALALAGTLPKDRDRLLAEVRGALAGVVGRRPWFMRGY